MRVHVCQGIPKDFANLTNLRRVSFSANKMKSLPAEIGEWVKVCMSFSVCSSYTHWRAVLCCALWRLLVLQDSQQQTIVAVIVKCIHASPMAPLYTVQTSILTIQVQQLLTLLLGRLKKSIWPTMISKNCRLRLVTGSV